MLTAATSCLVSCKKFLDIPEPPNQILSSDVFSNDNSASSAIVGIYSDMMANSYLNGYVTILAGMYADEITPTSSYSTASYIQFETNSLLANNQDAEATWAGIYPYIYNANACLEGITASKGMTQLMKNQLTGEAKFIRAFCNFYLSNLFGPIPLVITTEYKTNSKLFRSPITDINKQIESDLQDAMSLLSSDYRFSNGEKIRPNRWAAASLLARTYLYEQNWEKASELADTVINCNLYSLDMDLNDIFLLNSSEAIWQLLPVRPDRNTLEGNLFIPADTTTIPNFTLRDDLINSFEAGDNRRTNWVGSLAVSGQTYNYPYKYKVKAGDELKEYYMMIRLAELYLIRAEAQAHLNNINASVNDLNIIRQRSGLQMIPNSISSDSCLKAVAHERQIELMLEIGHRWFDLKRTGTAEAVLNAVKPGTWQLYDTLWPIPRSQINADPNITQNPGFQ